MNEKIDKLIEFLKIDEYEGDLYGISDENDEPITYTKTELRDEIKKILGIDKQCFQCLEYHFDHDLSEVEGTDTLICQECAKKIINGDIKLRE